MPIRPFRASASPRGAKAALFSELGGKDFENIPRTEIRHGKELLPSEELEKKELLAEIRWAIDELPEKQRLAIILSRYERMSYEDIADALDCSVQAVKSLLFRARQSLRKSLSKRLGK